MLLFYATMMYCYIVLLLLLLWMDTIDGWTISFEDLRSSLPHLESRSSNIRYHMMKSLCLSIKLMLMSQRACICPSTFSTAARVVCQSTNSTASTTRCLSVDEFHCEFHTFCPSTNSIVNSNVVWPSTNSFESVFRF